MHMAVVNGRVSHMYVITAVIIFLYKQRNNDYNKYELAHCISTCGSLV